MARIHTDAGSREQLPEWSNHGTLSGVGAVHGKVETQGEPSPEGAEWPADLDPELREFLELELALFEGLQRFSHIAEHRIRLKDDKPLKQRYYPKNPAMQRVIDDKVGELIQTGAIEPSRSLHSTPIVLVKKKTGEWRMCIDQTLIRRHILSPGLITLDFLAQVFKDTDGSQ
ncbi:uncharacterized protein LOC135435339 [Drosophila montana]|uniref:uncharacterized protein LOC135435339 n=1 Tax=Drosophila montana TaxID=40370 RepID=UPI00313D366F